MTAAITQPAALPADRRTNPRRLLVYAGLCLVLLLPLLGTTWLTLSHQREVAVETYRFQMESKADILAEGLSQAAWNLIEAEAAPLVESVFRDPRVVAIAARTDLQGPLISRAREPEAGAATQVLARDIRHGGVRIGTVTLTHLDAAATDVGEREDTKVLLLTALQTVVSMLITLFIIRAAGRASRAGFLEIANRHLKAHIEDRRQAGLALRASEARLRAMVDNSPSLILLKGLDGRYLMANRRAETFLGKPQREIVGARREDVLPANVTGLPDDAEILASENGLQRDVRVTGPDGAERDYVVLSFPIRAEDGKALGIGVTATEITAIKAVAKALREKQQHLELVVNSVPMLIGHLDRYLRYRLANRALGELAGQPEEGMIGLHVREVHGDAYFQQVQPHLGRALAGRESEVEVAVETPHLGRRQIRTRFVPERDGEGEVVGLFALGEDVTERAVMEAQLIRAQKMESIGQLTGGIAHDFNNILAVVLGNLELLESDLGDQPEPHRLVGNSIAAARRGASLTRQLLSFSRGGPQRSETLDLNALIANMREMLQRTLTGAIEVKVRLAEDLQPVNGDAAQIEAAILNLAINARDAMPGGGSLRIETASVDTRTPFGRASPNLAPGTYACITVTDTGTGMPAAVRDRIFEPFFTTKPPGKGTGLGLSMVYAFVTQAKGYIDVQSEPGAGTTFRIFLPSEQEAARARPHAAPPAGRPRGTETILVVEDDEAVRDISRRMLGALGYTIVCAPNGQEALAELERRSDIALLFSDVVMPGMSGVDLARQVKEKHPDMPILLTSGFPGAAIPSESPFPLIPKPVHPDELAQAVRGLLDAAAAGAAAP